MASRLKSTVRFGFGIACVVCVMIMISFWIFKFKIEDRSIGVVDYETLDEAEVELPILSLCFMNPFKPKELKKIGQRINSTSYLQYLKGQRDGDQFRRTNYATISLSLQDYFEFVFAKLSTDSSASKPNMISFDHIFYLMYPKSSIFRSLSFQRTGSTVWSIFTLFHKILLYFSLTLLLNSIISCKEQHILGPVDLSSLNKNFGPSKSEKLTLYTTMR